MPKESIIICASHSFNDPLFNGLIYQYIRQFKEKHPEEYIYHFFTEEMPAHVMNKAEQEALKLRLAQEHIHWHPITYRGGKFILFKKLWNFIHLFGSIWKIKRQEQVKILIGFLAIAGGYSYIIATLLRLKLMVFCFEPHSLYMKEFGIWSENSLKFKLLNKIEKLQATKADYVVVPTIHTINLLQKWQSKAKLCRVPISVDTEKFYFSAVDASRIRHQHDIPADRYVVLYLGKFGGIYYQEKEVAAYCKQLLDFDSNIFFLTISPNDSATIRAAYLAAGLAESDFCVLDKIPYEEVQHYISASDMGLVAIPPLDSQKYRTPVKIGNYLACGIPFIVTKGIADDDIMAKEENVGVVFGSLDQADVSVALPKLKELMYEDKQSLRLRCRAAAIKHRGIHNSVQALENTINDL